MRAILSLLVLLSALPACASARSLVADGEVTKAIDRAKNVEDLRLIVGAVERAQPIRAGVRVVSRDELLAMMQRLADDHVPRERRPRPEALAAKADAALDQRTLGIAFASSKAWYTRDIGFTLQSVNLDVQSRPNRDLLAEITREQPMSCGPRRTLLAAIGLERESDDVVCESFGSWVESSPVRSALDRLFKPEELLSGVKPPPSFDDAFAGTVFEATSPDARLVAMNICLEVRGYTDAGNLALLYEVPLGGESPARAAGRFPGGSLPVGQTGARRLVSLVNGNGRFSDPPGGGEEARGCSRWGPQ